MNSSWGNWHRTTTGGRASASFSYPVFDMLAHQHALFDAVFAFKPVGAVTVPVNGEPERVQAQLVSGDFYSGAETHPASWGSTPATLPKCSCR
jgi:hypothetical protein